MTPADRMGRLDGETLHYVECLARKISRHLPAHVDRDDIQQAAKLAAVEAALAFDDSYGAPFTAYLAIRVRGAITDHLRSLDFATRGARAAIDAGRARNADQIDPARVLSLDSHPATYEMLPSTTPTPEQIALLAAAWDTVRQAITELPPRERAAVLSLEFGDIGRSAQVMGVTGGRVSQLRTAGAKRIRAHLHDRAITRSDFDRQP